MKKLFSIAVSVFFAVVLLAGCSKANAKKDYILATGGTGGTYYPFGGAIANIWNTKIENMNVTAQATGASAENLRLINKGDAEFGTVQNDVMDYAFNGTDMFAGEKLSNIATIGTLYPEVIQIAVSENSGINSIYDFKGKRISVGDAGSGVEFNAKQIMEGYGLTFNDIKKSNLSFKESAEAIQNGTLDGCFITAGVPNAALQELAFSAGLKLIPVSGNEAATVMDKYGYYIYSFNDELYHSYVGILKNNDNVDKIKGYYQKLGYDIYMKEKNIDNEKWLIVLEQYNNLLSNTDDNNVIKAILEQTLKAYEKEEKIEN